MRKTGFFKLFLACLLAADCAVSVAQGQGGAEPPMASFLNGGVGEEERAMIAENAKDYSLKLTFTEQAGAYKADVEVVITDAKANEVLALEEVGPMLLVKLPAGKYRVKATSRGKAQQQTVNVRAKGLTELSLRW